MSSRFQVGETPHFVPGFNSPHDILSYTPCEGSCKLCKVNISLGSKVVCSFQYNLPEIVKSWPLPFSSPLDKGSTPAMCI